MCPVFRQVGEVSVESFFHGEVELGFGVGFGDLYSNVAAALELSSKHWRQQQLGSQP